MVDYSRFDKLDFDSDEEDHTKINPEILQKEVEWKEQQKAMLSQSSQIASEQSLVSSKTQKGKDGKRLKFEYQGRTVYEWEQTLSEVILYISPPSGVNKKLLDIRIQPNHLKVGIKGSETAYLDEDTGGSIVVDESMWMLDDGELIINLQKAFKAETWDCALKGQHGQKVDAHTKEELRKQMMLERFQEEHPGFDFSSAEFNGNVPDARDFMGGVKHF